MRVSFLLIVVLDCASILRYLNLLGCAIQDRFVEILLTKALKDVNYCAMFIRMVVSMTYYGLSLNTGNLGGDFYVNFLISGVVEFPAYTLCLLLLDRWGRKKCHCSAMLLGGIACLCTIFTISFGGEGS